MQLEELRNRWIEERPTYAAFGKHLCERLRHGAMRNGLYCTIDFRAKEVDSLVKKQLRKQYGDPWAQIRDKVGVRLIVLYPQDIAAAEELVQSVLIASKRDDKRSNLDPDKLGYQGIHYEVELHEVGLSGDAVKFRGLVAEVQIHTRAQNLWADVSHRLSYKTPQALPGIIKRGIFLLGALVEIFDQNLQTLRAQIRGQKGYEVLQMIDQLERHFYCFTTRDFDEGLSTQIVEGLRPLFTSVELQSFGLTMDAFIKKHEGKLRQIFDQYRDDQRCSPLLFQPESLLIFERMESDSFRLAEQWLEILPLTLLQDLGTVWGKAIPTFPSVE